MKALLVITCKWKPCKALHNVDVSHNIKQLRCLLPIQKRFGRQQIQIYIPALCPRAVDLPNTCLFWKVTLACGRFPYLSRALPACFRVNYIHKNRLMEPWGLQTLCLCVCMYASLLWHVCVCVVLSVVVLLWAQLCDEKGPSGALISSKNPRGRVQRKLPLTCRMFTLHKDNAEQSAATGPVLQCMEQNANVGSLTPS